MWSKIVGFLASLLDAMPESLKKELMRRILKRLLKQKSASEIANMWDDALKRIEKPDPNDDDYDETAKNITDIIAG